MMRKFLMIIFSLVISILTAEEFDIKQFSEPSKYGWNDMAERNSARLELESKQKMLQLYELNKQNVLTNMIKSAFAPGWGHYSAKDYTKGHAFIVSEIVLLGTSFYFYNQAMDDYHNYEDSNYIGEIKQMYLDANSKYKYSQLFFSLGAVVWLYTIYDSIGATQDYNQILWLDLSKQMHSKKLSITPTGITLRF